ncbi:transcription termination factor MTERF2, chloroplastic-like [Telopea speciosissima]|uniref:transcription termination factor MTERF2, chloroplastic-like n=1 Tax=Telopea speciosissima TaxID=54955 RepID=UPI001CC3969D|nr:transcription termination factor MTERF2, chloroplastic-like [Telopea speciosissima]
MFSFCSRKLLHMKCSGSSSTTCLLPIIGNSSLRFNSNATEQPSLTVDYLINRCGLTQESALKTSHRFNIKSTTKADSVLALLNSYGLPKPCISEVIRRNPTVLSVDLKKTLEPKIEFFSNMGISGPDLARILYRGPSILTDASLRNEIIPSIEFLKSFLHNGKNIAAAMSRLRWTMGFQRVMECNIEFLRNQGVPDSGISKLILLCPRALNWKQPRVNEVVLQANEMGCNSSSLIFI